MRVFILGTGRCGTMTFSKACSHITNFTSGHETHRLHPERYPDYPDNHIEVDAHLSFMLGSLGLLYGQAGVRFVHLWRDNAEVVKSFLPRRSSRSLAAVLFSITTPQTPEQWEVHMLRLIGVINTNIGWFLRYHRDWFSFSLSHAANDWPKFWDWIEAEGNMEAGRAEFNRHYNATHPRVGEVQ